MCAEFQIVIFFSVVNEKKNVDNIQTPHFERTFLALLDVIHKNVWQFCNPDTELGKKGMLLKGNF